jgi:thiamine biosynthesis lipoprotein ApbE
MEADAYATALLVLGAADGMDLTEQQDIAALLVERTGLGFRAHAGPALMHMAV